MWSTASAGCISITNRAARPVINTATLRYYKLQFITTVGTVAQSNMQLSQPSVQLDSEQCVVKVTREGGYLPLRELLWRREAERELCTELWSVG